MISANPMSRSVYSFEPACHSIFLLPSVESSEYLSYRHSYMSSSFLTCMLPLKVHVGHVELIVSRSGHTVEHMLWII